MQALGLLQKQALEFAFEQDPQVICRASQFEENCPRALVLKVTVLQNHLGGLGPMPPKNHLSGM